jgi:hypothetical protein
MRQELHEKHLDQKVLMEYLEQLWDVLDSLQDLTITEVFSKWKDSLKSMLNTYYHELFWFHACFSTYTIDAFPNRKQLFQELDHFIVPYKKALELFSGNVLQRLESLSQQVYAFRDRAGDFNLLYTGILSINLKKEEKQFQFELYTPSQVKELAKQLVKVEEKFIQSLDSRSSSKLAGAGAANDDETQKNYRLYTDEILRIAGYLAEERDMLVYCGSRKLFTGPQFIEEDFSLLYNEIIGFYENAITLMQRQSIDPLDNILELKSLRERARFELVYERHTEVVKFRALKKTWELFRDRE